MKNQSSSSFVVEIDYRGTKQNLNYLYSDAVRMKKIFEKIIPISIDKSIEYITVTKENKILFDIESDYFEIDFIEIIEDNRNLKVNNSVDFKIAVGLNSCDENGNLLTPNDSCGICCVTFEIDNLDEIKQIEIE